MYSLLRDFLFNFDAEDVHHFSMKALKATAKIKPLKDYITNQFRCEHPSLYKQVFGLPFVNPVGLAAGFDKNAIYLEELAMLGFGFVEIGTVTPLPQQGNEKPRLFRLSKDQAIINRMGFNNHGVKAVAARLRSRRRRIIIGGNIGKNKSTANEDAWKDYAACFTELFDCVDYFVVNVSSPNTPGLRALQEKTSLKKILDNLQNLNHARFNPKPLLLKIAPDLTVGQLDDIVELSAEMKLSGLVTTNTTTSRSDLKTDKSEIDKIGNGGLSGMPLKEKSTQIVQYISKHTSIPIIASGGIFNATHAKEKLEAGASLIQVWTGFVYEGLSIAKNICKGLIS